MSKRVKDLITREYQADFDGIESACVINLVGLDAVSTNRLRGELRSKNIRLQVVKNRLARRAFTDGPLAPLGRGLNGPCALVTGESIIDVAKTLVDLRKTYPAIELKLGMLEGDPELLEVERLAKMKSLADLQSELAMLIASPGRRLAGCVAGPGGRIAGCLKAMADKEGGEAVAA
jgi:large subunit ribosomal protein L10